MLTVRELRIFFSFLPTIIFVFVPLLHSVILFLPSLLFIVGGMRQFGGNSRRGCSNEALLFLNFHIFWAKPTYVQFQIDGMMIKISSSDVICMTTRRIGILQNTALSLSCISAQEASF